MGCDRRGVLRNPRHDPVGWKYFHVKRHFLDAVRRYTHQRLQYIATLALTPNTSNVSNYMFLTPFFALLLEYVVTNDLPGIATFIGGGVIMASLGVFYGRAERHKVTVFGTAL